jgi:cell division protein ZapA
MSEAEPVPVQILDKEYLIVCPPEERAALVQSAALLNEQLREIRGTGKVIGIERMVVMAALNMANELSRLRAVGPRVKQLRERVERGIERSRQLEL